MVVGIMEFRDDRVVRERIYFGDPWEPPAWRAKWIERFDPHAPDSSVTLPSQAITGTPSSAS